MNTQVNTLPQTPKESEDRQSSSQTDLWVSKYIKWKLSFDLVICQVSRDGENEERRRKRGRRVENGRKGVCTERVCEESKTKGRHSKKVQDKEVERVEDRQPWPIKSPFEVFRGNPREGKADLISGRGS